MALTPDERLDLEEQIMQADLAQKLAAAKLATKQDRWELVKVLAAFLAATAVLSGAIIGLSNWLHPASQQPMFPPGTVITIPSAK